MSAAVHIPHHYEFRIKFDFLEQGFDGGAQPNRLAHCRAAIAAASFPEFI
jgi:hypothetical protein